MNWPRLLAYPSHLLRISSFSYRWATLLSTILIWALVIGTWNTFGVFFKPISQDMGWSRASTSLAMSLGMITSGTLAPLTGTLADRHGARSLAIGSGLLLALSYTLLAYTQTLWQFYLFYILGGLAMSANYVPLVMTVSRWFPEKRGLALGLAGIGPGLGQAIMPVLASRLIAHFQWRTSYLLLGPSMGALVVLAALAQRSPPNTGKTMSSSPLNRLQGNKVFTLSQALRSRNFWLVVLAGALFSFNLQIVTMHLVNYATDPGKAIPATVAAAFLSTIGLANLLGKVTMGPISDNIGHKQAMAISFSLTIAMMLWLSIAGSPWMFYLFAAGHGFAYGAFMPLYPSILGDLFGLTSIGSITGAVTLGNAWGGAMGTFLAGQIYDITDSYLPAFFLSTGLVALGLTFLLQVKRP